MGVFVPAPIFIPPVIVKCSDKFITLSKLSGGVTLTLHCPGDLIETSLWTNRNTCIQYQLCYLNLLIKQITQVSNAVGDSLTTQLNYLLNELNTLPQAIYGMPVTHEYFNAIWDYIDFAYKVLTDFFSIVWGYGNSQPFQVSDYENQLLYVINNVPKKQTMDLMKSSDWNALTQALYAIDQILQFIKQNWYIQAIQGTILTTQPIQLIPTSLSSIETPIEVMTVSTSMTTSAGAKQS